MNRRLVIALSLFGLAPVLFAQQAQVLAPHRPAPPELYVPKRWPKSAVSRSVVGGLWMVDPNLKSSIYVKNNVETSSLSLTPVLYLSNGKQIVLSTVTLEAAGTRVISINDALREQGIAPYATLSGYVEIRYNWPWDALCVTVQSLDVAHSLIYSSGLRSSQAVESNSNPSGATQNLEGMWWKQESGVTGFVALSNTTSRSLSAYVQTSDKDDLTLAKQVITVSAHGTKLVDLPELQTVSSSEGGIRVSYSGPKNALVVNGELVDRAVGYSATMPFLSAGGAEREQSARNFAELGLMVGAADPMMRFPAGTVFTPYSLAHNVSDLPVSFTPAFYWMEGSVSRSSRVAQVTVAAHQTMNLNLPLMLATAGLGRLNGSVSLILEAESNADALLLASGSVDQKNTYVFQVLPRAASESLAQIVSYWSTRNGDDTMVTLWNPADEEQDFIFVIFFSGGRYSYPVHLNPRASRMFNISEITNSQIPDKDGNVIPTEIHEGSAEIMGSRGPNENILVSMEAGTYSVQKATCPWFCRDCFGMTGDVVDADPFTVTVGGQTQLTIKVQFSNGHEGDYTSTSTWTSSNTSVATVSSGLTRGVATGSVTAKATTPPLSSNPGQVCGAPPGPCPVTPAQGSSPGTVHPTVTISGPGNIPMLQAGTQGTDSITVTATGTPSGGTYSWTAVSGASNITILNGTSQSATLQSVAVGTYTAQVTYTLNNQPATAVTAGRVQQPGSLGVISNSTPQFNCANVGVQYITTDRQIQYQVLDTSSPAVPIPVTGMDLTETLNGISNTCGGQYPTPTKGAKSGSSGYFPLPDTLQMCSSVCLPANSNGGPSGICTMKVGQTWNVNGFPVKSDSLVYTCPGPPTGAP